MIPKAKKASLAQSVVEGPVDSGTSHHIFRNKDVFELYSPCSSSLDTAGPGLSLAIPGTVTS